MILFTKTLMLIASSKSDKIALRCNLRASTNSTFQNFPGGMPPDPLAGACYL